MNQRIHTITSFKWIPFVPKHFILLIAFEVKLKITQRFKLGKYCRNFALCLFRFSFFSLLFIHLDISHILQIIHLFVYFIIEYNNKGTKAWTNLLKFRILFFLSFFFLLSAKSVSGRMRTHWYFSRNVNAYISFTSQNVFNILKIVLCSIFLCVQYLTKTPN